jgi:hypothetical protein
MDILKLNFIINSEKLNIDDKTTKRFFEDALPNFQFNSFAFPKGVPDEAPRMIGTLTTELYSVGVQITNVSISATFNFAPSMQTEILKCLHNAYDINKNIYDVFRHATSKITFLGTTVDYRNNIDNCLKFMRDNFFTLKSNNDMFSIENNFAMNLHDTYFVNVALNAIKERKIGQESKNISNFLEITIDINNRYQWDFKNKNSQDEDYSFIKELHIDIANNKLDTLLQNKEFDLDEQ